jgi:enoyl-CoA hydratase/carnithine racemase
MDFETIRYEVADGVLTITLNRPDRLNAWTPTMQAELIEALDRADADDAVRAIVFTGAGRGYCAGADLEGGGSTFDWRERETGEADVPRDGGLAGCSSAGSRRSPPSTVRPSEWASR